MVSVDTITCCFSAINPPIYRIELIIMHWHVPFVNHKAYNSHMYKWVALWGCCGVYRGFVYTKYAII